VEDAAAEHERHHQRPEPNADTPARFLCARGRSAPAPYGRARWRPARPGETQGELRL
jgi:hypothetical protein